MCYVCNIASVDFVLGRQEPTCPLWAGRLWRFLVGKSCIFFYFFYFFFLTRCHGSSIRLIFHCLKWHKGDFVLVSVPTKAEPL